FSLWIAYTVVWLAYGLRLISASLLQVKPELEEAARVTGARQRLVYRDVTLPLIRFGLIGSWLLIFMMFVREYSTGVYLLVLGTAQILRGVSFQLQEREILALLGASGSGKTTLLRSVAGLERPDAGKIEIRGKLVFDAASGFEVPAEQRGLGLVFQSYAIWPHRSVFENVAYGLRVRRAPEAETRQKVGSILERLGLGQLADRYAHQ